MHAIYEEEGGAADRQMEYKTKSSQLHICLVTSASERYKVYGAVVYNPELN